MDKVGLQELATVGEDCLITLYDMNTQQINSKPNAHENSIYTCEFLSKDVLVSADDDGHIKIWDIRAGNPVYEVKEQTNGTITDLAINKEKSLLFATSNSGTLGVYDLRKPNTSKDKLYAMSDEMEEELNCIEFVRVRSKGRGFPGCWNK